MSGYCIEAYVPPRPYYYYYSLLDSQIILVHTVIMNFTLGCVDPFHLVATPMCRCFTFTSPNAVADHRIPEPAILTPDLRSGVINGKEINSMRASDL